MNFKLFLVLFILNFVSKIDSRIKSAQIKDLKLFACNNSADYLLQVSDVNIKIVSTGKINLSGSLFSQIDLIAPIQADLWVKRYLWGMWIPIPCENRIGSCSYPDLCKYGLPLDQTCPKVFVESNVPCRCPISAGNYTIKPTDFQLFKETAIVSGNYKGTVEISQNSKLLTCYNMFFTLFDELDNANYVVNQV